LHSIRSSRTAAIAPAISCTLSVNAWAQPAPKPAAAEPATSKEEVAALRSEAKSLLDDVQALREELKLAIGASTLPRFDLTLAAQLAF
jgi:hypothetical protein